MADETVVETPVVTESAPVDISVVPETPSSDASESFETPAPDPNDLFAAIDSEIPKDEPVAADQNAIPDQYKPAFELSEFVKTPETLQQAVRAADEVWKVASGQAPASGLLEGMRAANPQGFEGIVKDLTGYLEQITGKKFGGQPESVDPVQQLRTEMETRYAKEQQERQQTAYQQQAQAATVKTQEFVTSALKGTFAEGQDARFLSLLGAKGAFTDQVMKEVLSGNTKSLDKAIREVRSDEAKAWKAYGENLKKKQTTLANGVPAVKGAPAKKSTSSLAALPNETVAQQTERLIKAGLI